MSTTVATAVPAAEPTTSSTIATAPSTQPEQTTTGSAPASSVDDATYMMNTFSTLLEGDLYDDELNGKLIMVSSKKSFQIH